MKGNFQLGDIVRLTSNTNPNTKFIVTRNPYEGRLFYGLTIFPNGKEEIVAHESEMELIKRK